MIQTGPRQGGNAIFLLAGIAALGSLGTQLLVPVLPIVAHDLGTGSGAAQRLIAIYLVGLACGQLAAGPLFDRHGRRGVVLIGLGLFGLGSLLAALAASYPLLLGARFIQAIGGAVGIVGSRVLVSDLFPPDEAVRRQSTLMAFVLISPALAPALGGALGEALGWRTIMLVLCLAALGGMVWTRRSLPQLAPPATTRPRRLIADIARLAVNRRFLSATATIAGGSSALYLYLTAAPFLLAGDHGLSARESGLVLMLIAFASIAGTFCVAWIDRRRSALLTGSVLIAVAPVLLLAADRSGWHSLPALLVPMAVLGLGAGICGPAGIARVLRSEPGLEGTSTALCGALQMGASAACAGLFSQVAPIHAATLALALLAPASLALLAAWNEANC